MNPGPGELCDRLSVLSLKLLHKPSAEYQSEFDLIVGEVCALFGGSAFKVDDLLSLAAVNGQLWAFEDRIRDFRDDPKPLELDEGEVLSVAMGIQKLNDRRAQLIGEINAFHGVAT
jgi:hypothetical protein